MARRQRAGNDPLGTNPTPMSGAGKGSVDLVLGMIKAGSGLVSLLSGLLAGVLVLYSGYVLYDSLSLQYHAYSSTWDLMKYKPEILKGAAEPDPGESSETLAMITKDYRGWLTIYDSHIDYPVTQGEDDLYYASHDIYGNPSLTGAIYLSAGNRRDGSDSYNLIYGHHMDNDAMFGQLDSFRTRSFYDSHREGVWVTESGVYDLTSYGVIFTDAYENRIYAVGNRAAEVRAFLEGDRENDTGLGTQLLIYDREIARKAEKTLALSTCASAATNGRLVVLWRMTPRALPTDIPSPTATPAPTTKSSSATATPVPEEAVLTVRYVFEDGSEAFPAKTFTYATGSGYRVVSPRLSGYAPSPAAASGTILSDTQVTVVYRLQLQDLTIRYLHLDGSEAAERYRAALYPGEAYRVENPVLEGYVTAESAVKGVMGGEDTEIAVLYLPKDLAGELKGMEDLEVSLGLSHTWIQSGLGIE